MLGRFPSLGVPIIFRRQYLSTLGAFDRRALRAAQGICRQDYLMAQRMDAPGGLFLRQLRLRIASPTSKPFLHSDTSLLLLCNLYSQPEDGQVVTQLQARVVLQGRQLGQLIVPELRYKVIPISVNHGVEVN